MSKNSSGSVITIVLVSIGLIVLPMLCRVNKKLASYKNSQGISKSFKEDKKSYDSRYHLEFSDDFKKGLTSQDDLGISILIAIDVSGSMDDPPMQSPSEKKYIIASRSLTEITNFLEDYYNKLAKNEGIKMKIGLIRFSSDVDVLFDMSEMNNANFSRLRNITSNRNNFKPTYKTAIGKTLERGTEILAQSGTIFKSLIVITDGENTVGEEPEEVLTAIVNNLNNKNTEDFPVLTDNILVSFVGFDIDTQIFANLKNIGARVTSAENEEELNTVLKNIFIADITKLEGE